MTNTIKDVLKQFYYRSESDPSPTFTKQLNAALSELEALILEDVIGEDECSEAKIRTEGNTPTNIALVFRDGLREQQRQRLQAILNKEAHD